MYEETVLHEGDLRAGQSVSTKIDWTLPATGEVSFDGRHVKCDWMVDVLANRPKRTDLHLKFPITVVGA
jgi:hypothetical protein